MTEPTNEQIERAAKDAGWHFPADVIRAGARDIFSPSQTLECSILAHARTIAEKEEAEAREARLIEQIRLDRDTFRDCDIIDDPIGAAAQLEAAMHNCNAILQENPDG